MATAKYTTLGEGTLNGAHNNSTTSIVLNTGQGASFPSAGDFWIRINDEILKATSRSGDTITATRGQEGTSAASHSSGDTVTEVVTAAMLDQLRQDWHQTGTDASKSAEKAGNLYLPNDGFQLYRDTGSTFAGWGPLFPLTLPVNGDFSWVNQGAATVSTTKGGIVLYDPGNATTSWRLRVKTAPTPPYRIYATFLVTGTIEATTAVALVFRQSSDGKLALISRDARTAGVTIYATKWDSPTSFSATYTFGNGIAYGGHIVHLSIEDDNTNRKMYISGDGQNWIQLHSVGRTDFLTANQVGFGLTAISTEYPGYVTLLSWREA